MSASAVFVNNSAPPMPRARRRRHASLCSDTCWTPISSIPGAAVVGTTSVATRYRECPSRLKPLLQNNFSRIALPPPRSADIADKKRRALRPVFFIAQTSVDQKRWVYFM
ncbi:hypothetical protein [Xanthomonas sp. 1678]|uniref:hypothetical protein n=1 Tax=Xanthomonas sp. 1678 TaxID=3158788 RepID=UPI00285843C9|nr:hypothetical protein [Xanthomonas translucens]